MRYDWDKGGSLDAARVNRMGARLLAVLAAVAWPLWLYFAVTWWWPVIAVPVLLTAIAAVRRLALCAQYGVREPDALRGFRAQDRQREKVYRDTLGAVRAVERAQRRGSQARPAMVPPVPVSEKLPKAPPRGGGLVINGSEAKLVPYGTERGFLPPSEPVTWEASAVLDWNGFREVRLGPARPLTPFPDAGNAPVIVLVPRDTRAVGVIGAERSAVASWTAATGAASPVSAYEALAEAEPLLVGRMSELAFDHGRRYFRLAHGELLAPCVHPGAVPVDTLWTGERVAYLCPECDAQLPSNWGDPA